MPRIRGIPHKQRKQSKKERDADAEARTKMKTCASEVEKQCGIIATAFKVLEENVRMHGGALKSRFMDGVSSSGEAAFMSGTVVRDVEKLGSNAARLVQFVEDQENGGE